MYIDRRLVRVLKALDTHEYNSPPLLNCSNYGYDVLIDRAHSHLQVTSKQPWSFIKCSQIILSLTYPSSSTQKLPGFSYPDHS